MLERVMVVESAIVVSAAVVKAMSNACVNFTSTYNVLIEQDQSKSEPTRTTRFHFSNTLGMRR